MTNTLPRAAGAAALLVLPLILTYEVIGPTLLAGAPRPSGSIDAATLAAYYAHGDLAVLTLVGFATVPLAGLFLFGLGATLWPRTRSKAWLVVAGAAFVAEVPIILATASLQAAIAATGGASPALFRAWDVLWNSGVYILECLLVLSLGCAMRGATGFPRWASSLSFLTAAALGFNVLVLWLRLPPEAALPANLLFSAWFVANGILLLRGRADDADPEAGARPA